MYERIKKYLLDESKGYTIIRTYYERPRFFIVGCVYILAILIILTLVASFTTLFGTVLAPLAAFEPILKPFFNMETGQPKNLIGWGVVASVVVFMICSLVGLLMPGLYLIIFWQKQIDKEWPDDPDKTQQWREKHAD